MIRRKIYYSGQSAKLWELLSNRYRLTSSLEPNVTTLQVRQTSTQEGNWIKSKDKLEPARISGTDKEKCSLQEQTGTSEDDSNDKPNSHVSLTNPSLTPKVTKRRNAHPSPGSCRHRASSQRCWRGNLTGAAGATGPLPSSPTKGASKPVAPCESWCTALTLRGPQSMPATSLLSHSFSTRCLL